MTEKQSLQGAEQYVKDNEFMKFVIRYRFVLVAAVVALIVGGIGGVFYSKQKKESNEKSAELIYRFESESLAAFSEKKIDIAAFNGELKKLRAEVSDYEGLVGLLLKIADLHMASGAAAEAIAILEDTSNTFGKDNVYGAFMIDIRLATAYENEGQFDKAIVVLERLSASSVKILERKVYLDLGRLYVKSNQPAKAKVALDMVLKGDISDTFSKMAKIYLENIAGQTK